jgi:TonB-dependent starch-binding outer membrane protein SusC
MKGFIKRRSLCCKFLLLVVLYSNLQIVLIRGYATVQGQQDDKKQQQVSLNGEVVNSDGVSIKGVLIQSNGRKISVTNASGLFNIKVDKESVIRFSTPNYEEQSIVAVDNQSDVRIVIEKSGSIFNNDVNLGYRTQGRGGFTGSSSTVYTSEANNQHALSIEDILGGLVPGLTVSHNSGIPGYSSHVAVRGIRTLQLNSNPIYVVDGIIINTSETGDHTENLLSAIDPNNIERVDVLKDAAATSLYGAQAANGVVVVTSKKGKLSQNPVLKIGGQWGVNSLPKKYDAASILGSGSVDEQSNMFQTAFTNQYHFSCLGGGETSSYNIGAGYLNEKGIMSGSGMTRFTSSVGSTIGYKSWLEAGMNVLMNVSNQNNVAESWDQLRYTLDPAAEPNGYSAQYVMKSKTATGKRYMGNGRAYVEIRPSKKTTLRSEMTDNASFTEKNYFGQRLDTTYSSDVDYAEPLRSQYKHYINEFTWRNILTYQTTFGKIHQLKVLGGHEYKSTYDNYTFVSRTGSSLDDAYLPDINAGSDDGSYAGGVYFQYKTVSYFGDVNYGLLDRYFLTGTFRQDGNSLYSAGNRWESSGSGGFAWRVSNEPFMKGVKKVMDELKIRGSYGVVGNNNISKKYYSNLDLYSYSNQNGISSMTIMMDQSDAGWEKTNTLNIGLDMSFLNGRIQLSADAYRDVTKNLLFQVPLVSSDFQRDSTWFNVGSLKNRGFELSLKTINVNNGNFVWNTSVNFACNKNEVISLNTEGNYINAYDWSSENQNSGILTRTAQGHSVAEFYDATNDKFLGSASPKTTIGFVNSFKCRDFDFSFMLYSRIGAKAFNYTSYALGGYSDYAGNVEKADYLRMKNMTLGYNLSSKISQKFKITNMRIYANVTNLFTVTSYSGYDPEIGNAAYYTNRNTGVSSPSVLYNGVDAFRLPNPRTVSIGLEVTL